MIRVVYAQKLHLVTNIKNIFIDIFIEIQTITYRTYSNNSS